MDTHDLQLEGLLPHSPTPVRLHVETLLSEGDPEVWALEWVRDHSHDGGWVMLSDRVLARQATDIGWTHPNGDEGTLQGGYVLSAEGIDREGRPWRLRWLGDRPQVWRITEGTGTPAQRFHRRYLSTWAGAERLVAREYWTRQPRPGLQGAAPWSPFFSCFHSWER